MSVSSEISSNSATKSWQSVAKPWNAERALARSRSDSCLSEVAASVDQCYNCLNICEDLEGNSLPFFGEDRVTDSEGNLYHKVCLEYIKKKEAADLKKAKKGDNPPFLSRHTKLALEKGICGMGLSAACFIVGSIASLYTAAVVFYFLGGLFFIGSIDQMTKWYGESERKSSEKRKIQT